MNEFSQVLADFQNYQRIYIPHQQHVTTAFATHAQFLKEQALCVSHHDNLQTICLFLELMDILSQNTSTQATLQKTYDEVLSAYESLEIAARQRPIQQLLAAEMHLHTTTTHLDVFALKLSSHQKALSQDFPDTSPLAVGKLTAAFQQHREEFHQQAYLIQTLTEALQRDLPLTQKLYSEIEKTYLITFTKINHDYPMLAKPALKSALAICRDKLNSIVDHQASTNSALLELNTTYQNMRACYHFGLPRIVTFFLTLQLQETPEVFLARRLPDALADFNASTTNKALLSAAEALEQSLHAYTSMPIQLHGFHLPSSTMPLATSFSHFNLCNSTFMPVNKQKNIPFSPPSVNLRITNE